MGLYVGKKKKKRRGKSSLVQVSFMVQLAAILSRAHAYIEASRFIPFKALLGYFNHFVPTQQ